jgi:hypothetical protein
VKKLPKIPLIVGALICLFLLPLIIGRVAYGIAALGCGIPLLTIGYMLAFDLGKIEGQELPSFGCRECNSEMGDE